MLKINQIFLFLFCFLQWSCAQNSLIIGAYQTQNYLPQLKDRSVGIVANQTSMINATHLVDSLLSSGVNIVKVFSPEHGFRGKADAGAHISDSIDKKTALPIISLYGKNKKPSPEQLKGIDILLFDIQDVGARFYTYISTLHYVMESAAEHKIPVVVLDRPNPNGHYIDGPVLDTNFRSFVGMHPVPIVHGMTIGEYAQMINKEAWLDGSLNCDLTIIPMVNYNRNIIYRLPVKPSPNLPNAQSINLYPSLCLFEGTNVSVGRGTSLPFQHYGSPNLNSDYSFIPYTGAGSKYPKHEGLECFGRDLSQFNQLNQLNLNFLIEAYRTSSEKDKFFNSFFDKLAGNSWLKQQIIEGKSVEEIRESWQEDLGKFKQIRQKYLMY
ncbi:MAG: exo-beta-N-acetylmuramidase NamZ domain-containing protein [Flavobacteriales bacterium]